MRPLSDGELAAMQVTQEAAMGDECVLLHSSNFDASLRTWGRKLDRVSEQVKEHVVQQRRVTKDWRKRSDLPGDASLLRLISQFSLYCLNHPLEIHFPELHLGTAGT